MSANATKSDAAGEIVLEPSKEGISASTPGLKNRIKFLVSLFSDTSDRFSENDGFRLVASFSYYATFSIFPLLLLAVTVVGYVVGDDDYTRTQLIEGLGSAPAMREVVGKTLASMQESSSARGISAIIGLVSLFFAASGAFVEVDAALNRIWCVPERKSKGFLGTIRVYAQERLAGFIIVAGLGLTILVSLISSTALSFVAEHKVALPFWPALMRTAGVGTSLFLLSVVFTLAFHFIPRSRPPIRVVIPGAILTTVLLSALKEVFAFYLSKLTGYSAYGVVGGVLGLATWIYLSSTIIFLGAQLTRIHAEKIGAVKPGCQVSYPGRPAKA